MTNSSQRIEIVAVTYHSTKTAEREVRQLIEAVGGFEDCSLTFVDNSEDSGDARLIRRYLTPGDKIKVIENPENTGFAAGCNLAVDSSPAEWIILLNPDITLPTHALRRARDFLIGLDPSVATVAFSQSTQGMIHEGIAFNWAGWFMDRPLSSRTVRAAFLRALGAGELVGPSGGAGAFRRKAYLDAGGFWEGLFAWGEDAEFALRMRLLGNKTTGLDLRLSHLGGHSVTTRTVSRRRARLLIRNRFLLAARLFTLPQTLLLAGFTIIVFTGKIPFMLRHRTLSANLFGIVDGLREFRHERDSWRGPRKRLFMRWEATDVKQQTRRSKRDS